MIHVHYLDGCAPTPLAHYLKALGILRLVAEQADNDARGWWDGDHFRLATRLNRDELEQFFADEYQPTPIFNPWGARSGFYDGTSEKSARASLNRIMVSKSPRLEPFRTAIETVRSVVTRTTEGDKPTENKKKLLILALRAATRAASSLWLDTVVAVVGLGDDAQLVQPPVFGTGGSEGSGGYPSAYMSAIVESIVEPCWNHALTAALFGGVVPSCRWDQSMGQFAPGSVSTPWDLLLAFEGACMLRSSVASRASIKSKRWMSSPFYVAPRSSGYSSGARLDEKFLNKGREYPGRGEQWLPMWANPSRMVEVQQLFAQGRAFNRAERAMDGWTMARATAGFGISQGVTQFVRFGYQQRNNQATHFAVPLGRFVTREVEPTTNGPRSCLDDIERWLSDLRKVAHPSSNERAKRVPARLVRAYGSLMDALFSAVSGRADHRLYQDVLLRLEVVEATLRRGTGFSAGVLPPLRPDWIAASDDRSTEFRLALAFALQSGGYRIDGRRVDDHVRRHWLPLAQKRAHVPADPEREWRFASVETGNSMRLAIRSEVVMQGRRGVEDAIALIERRLVEASQQARRHLPLQAGQHMPARVADLAALLSGGVDLDRTLKLARALMALDRKAWDQRPVSVEPTETPHLRVWPEDAWLAIRLCTLPWPLRTRSGFKLDIGANPALVRRLAGGDVATAFIMASRRLAVAGVRCTVRVTSVSPDTARLWAAALAFPISKRIAESFLYRIDPNKE